MSLCPRVVRVLPEGTIDKTFDYLVPEHLGDQVRVGTLVRVELNRRRVRAWVVGDDVEPPAGVTLRPLAKVTGWGPPADLVDLAGWAAWRWAGRRSWFLGTASPPGAVTALPSPAAGRSPVPVGPTTPVDELAASALGRSRSVVRLPPLADSFPVVVAAARRGPTLVLTPAVAEARRLGARLRRTGISVAVLPAEWAAARAGVDVVVGARAGAWGPVPGLAAAVVLDEHDESYQEEQTTTWHARDVVAERARRAGVPCVLVSPTPTLESLDWAGEILVPARRDERAGWPILDVVDRRKEDPGRTGLYSERLVAVLRSGARVVCVLNRKGRARLLACARCGEATRCEHCAAAVAQQGDGTLVCRRCGTTRPVVCQSCGATKLKNLRVGVTRAREELEALVREPVAELSGAADRSGPTGPPAERIVVGTEAALHQVDHADVVAFLDIDQELLAPRYRAAEQALALLVRGARLLGRSPRPASATAARAGGRLLVQTRLPQHEVLQAALHADPTRVADAERTRRELLRFPPVAALAAVSGPAAAAFVEGVAGRLGVEVLGPADGVWLVRADGHDTLAGALQGAPRPATGRLRIEVDPPRL